MIMKQESLFDVCENYHGGNANSVDAFKKASGSASALRAEIFRYLVQQGSKGATCDEIEVALGIAHQTCSARCADLKREGAVYEYGKRKTRTGSNAGVLIARTGKCNFWSEEK